MSAIYGVVNLDGDLIPESIGKNFYESYNNYRINKHEQININNCLFGCALQYITPEDQREVLPFFDKERNTVFTADCMIDNREELINELEIDSDSADGSIIYAAYTKWGKDAFSRLRGMFAIAIYDINKSEVILATDQFSQRSLIYHRKGNTIYFSTLLFPLVRDSGLKFDINERWVVNCISVLGPTMWLEPRENALNDVLNVLSGTYEVFTPAGSEVITYYDPIKTVKTDKSITLEKSGEIIRSTMERVERQMLRPGIKVAAQLSCGLDSTSVACTAARIVAERGENIYSYTSIPSPEAGLENRGYNVVNETGGVEVICDEYSNIIPTFVDCKNRHFINEVNEMVETWNAPCKSLQNAIWIDEIAKEASGNGCTVILGGSCGNTTISAGDHRDIFMHYVKRLNLKAAYDCLELLPRLGAPRKRYIKNLIKDLYYYYRWYINSSERDAYKNVLTDKSIGEKHKWTKRYGKEYSHYKPYNSFAELRSYMYLPNAYNQIGHIDTAYSLKYGIVLRDPTRTVDIVDMCLKMPLECFASSDADRRLVRKGMEGVVPEKVRMDIKHRGRQSADNIFRIVKGWPEKGSTMKNELKSSILMRYFDSAKAEELINRIDEKIAKGEENKIILFVDMCSCGIFMDKLKPYLN